MDFLAANHVRIVGLCGHAHHAVIFAIAQLSCLSLLAVVYIAASMATTAWMQFIPAATAAALLVASSLWTRKSNRQW